MESALVGFVLALASGAAIAALNGRLARAALQKGAAQLSALFVVRQVLNVSYLAALFLLSGLLPWDMAALLIGGALGITVPSIFFTRRLVKRNDALNREERDKARKQLEDSDETARG